MDAASSQPGDVVLPLPVAVVAAADPPPTPALTSELYALAEAGRVGLTLAEFASVLAAVGRKLNYNQPPADVASATQRETFFRSLKLPELALAHACVLGREEAWQRFLAQYRAPLTQAATAITGSATLGHDLADSLYAELYGLKEEDGERRSPLASYTGRGSLMGWLRTTLAQRHIDHHRRTHREEPLDETEPPAQASDAIAQPAKQLRLTHALRETLRSLAAEDRFLLSSYFLDRRTLLEISRTLHVHEATISRRLKRLTDELRKRLLGNLQAGGLSKRAAEEALGADPRDIEINLRALLQTSQTAPFQERAVPDAPAKP